MSAWVVLEKECRDNLRDRRTLISSLTIMVLGPVLFALLLSFMLNSAVGESTEPVRAQILGADRAPNLVAYLSAQNTELKLLTDAATNPRALVADDPAAVVLEIPESFETRFAAGQVIDLPIYRNSSTHGASQRNYARLRELIGRYSFMLGSQRLMLRGVDPATAAPMFVRDVDLATPEARALSILSTLPYFIALVIFMGGFYLAIDTTAGEREHGSLEPLLTQPLPRRDLVLGKIGATCLFAAAALLLFLVSFALALPFVPLHQVGMSLTVGPAAVAGIWLIGTPLIAFAAAMLTCVASFAKSYKEAQIYLTVVVLIPTLPIIAAQLMNLETSAWLMLVPSLAQATLMSDLISGDDLRPAYVLIASVSTIAYAALLTLLAVHLYRQERILG